MDKSIKIAFFDSKEYDITTFEDINKEYNFKIKYYETKLNEDSVELAKGNDIVCVFVNDIIDANVIKRLKELGTKIIALRCAGYNNLDTDALKEKNMIAVRVPEYSPYAVAEHALALILTLNRKIHKAYNRTKEHNFSLNGLLGFDIHGKTVGVIGTGKIGRVFCNTMNSLGANVVAYDMYPDENFAKENNVKYVSLDELYNKSDIISLHCPLNKDTHNIINKDTISKMKDGVMIINTGRGGLIHTEDIFEALKSKKVGSVGLDVYEEESDFFSKDMSNEIIKDDLLSVILTMPNVVMTAHQAYFTKEALNNIASTTLKNIYDVLNNNECNNYIK